MCSSRASRFGPASRSLGGQRTLAGDAGAFCGGPLRRLLALLTVGALLVVPANSATAQQSAARAAVMRPPPGATTACRVDPAVELLSVIQTLANDTRPPSPEAPRPLDFAYRREVRAWFAPVAGHPAVVTGARLIQPGANHVAATLGAGLSAPPLLRERRPWPRAIGEGTDAIGRDSLRAFVDRVRDFARRSDFERFFAEHEPFYAKLCADVVAGGELADAAAATTRFYGVRPKMYEVALMPLVPYLGVAAPGPPIGRGSTLTAFVGPARVEGDEPKFRTGWELTRVLLHEFSHRYVNPLVAASAPSLARSAPLFDPARGRLWRANRVGSWPGAVDETVVRAAVALMRADAAGDSAMHAELRQHRVIGFVLIDSVAAELAAARARGEWPLATTGARLIRLFDRLAASPTRDALLDLPFEGGMVAALRGREADSLIFIVPTEGQDRALQDSLCAHVRDRASRYRQAAVLTDREALGRDLGAHTLWAVGTFGGNAWLRAHAEAVPALVGPDRIETDSTMVGHGLVFVTALPNPDNPRRALLLTVGQRLDELAIGWWLLADDYAVVDGERVLSRGTYVKRGQRWSFPDRAPIADRPGRALP